MIININKITKKEINCLNINQNEEADPAILSQTCNSNSNSLQQLHKK